MADLLKPPSPPSPPNEIPTKQESSHGVTLANNTTMPAEEPLTMDAFLRLRARQMGTDPIVAYPSSGIDYVEYSPHQLNASACRAAKHYACMIPLRSSSAESEVTIAILGPSNLEYLITLLALTKLGHTVLFLSTRLSVVAYVSLLWTTGAKHLLIDQSFQKVAASVRVRSYGRKHQDRVDYTFLRQYRIAKTHLSDT
jgi:acyl-CoA synthetase (AMP-forming)/AMP-acid ligase II